MSGVALPEIRVGTGSDVHAYAEDRPMHVAGILWPGEAGLTGHSDGDVACHAIVDALLAAAGLGDIGELVGIDQEHTRDAASTGFIALALQRLHAEGWTPINVSVQIIGVRPKLAPRRAEAEAKLSKILGAPVSVSATTSDGLGFTGRGEGLAAIATALIARTGESAT